MGLARDMTVHGQYRSAGIKLVSCIHAHKLFISFTVHITNKLSGSTNYIHTAPPAQARNHNHCVWLSTKSNAFSRLSTRILLTLFAKVTP